MKARLLFSALLFSFFLPLSAFCSSLPTAPPESVGLSPERLKRITDTLNADISKGEIPGAVLLIARQGKIACFEAMGSLDPEKKTPITKDAIFRIYSMTK
jgi:CubicO group peptidase (beta-lactamase class C family)